MQTQPWTLQQTYDYICSNLIKQGKRSLSAGGACRYRGPLGERCAVGFLISDDDYNIEFESKAFPLNSGVSPAHERLVAAVANTIGEITPEHRTLIRQLQQVHDHQPNWPGVLNLLSIVGKVYKLDTSVVVVPKDG